MHTIMEEISSPTKVSSYCGTAYDARTPSRDARLKREFQMCVIKMYNTNSVRTRKEKAPVTRQASYHGHPIFGNVVVSIPGSRSQNEEWVQNPQKRRTTAGVSKVVIVPMKATETTRWRSGDRTKPRTRCTIYFLNCSDWSTCRKVVHGLK